MDKARWVSVLFLRVFQGQCPFHVEDIGVTVVGYSTILGEYRVLIGETFLCSEDSWGSQTKSQSGVAE